MAAKLTVVYETTVQGSGKMPYSVKFYSDGSNYCTCPAWRFKKDLPATERWCKHTIAKYKEASLALSEGIPSDEEDLA